MLRHQDNVCGLARSPITVIEGGPTGNTKMISFAVKEEIGIGVYNPAALSRFPPEGVVVPIDEQCLGKSIDIPEGLRLCGEPVFAV